MKVSAKVWLIKNTHTCTHMCNVECLDMLYKKDQLVFRPEKTTFNFAEMITDNASREGGKVAFGIKKPELVFACVPFLTVGLL